MDTKKNGSARPVVNAPSLANCDFMRLPEDVRELVQSGIRFFHIDIMDGHYVPNFAFPIRFVSDFKSAYPDCTADVHLMASEPERWIPELAEAGADCVSFHADSTRFVHRTVAQIHRYGMKAGVVLNPSQPVASAEPYLPLLDYVVLMTVEPGFAGQRFLDGSLERLGELNACRNKLPNRPLIEIDGGVDRRTAESCVLRGADILVTGVFVTFSQPGGISAAVRRFADALETMPRSPESSSAPAQLT